MCTHNDILERLARIESRLCQTMLFIGADLYKKNEECGIAVVISEAVADYFEEADDGQKKLSAQLGQ